MSYPPAPPPDRDPGSKAPPAWFDPGETPPRPPAPGSPSALAGWIIFLAALGMMANLLGADFQQMQSWGTLIETPAFIGRALIHFGTVVAAFVGGYLIPNRNTWSPEYRAWRLADRAEGPPR